MSRPLVEGCLAVSIGEWGGFYAHKGYAKRLCLGWIAFTWLPEDGDQIIEYGVNWAESLPKIREHMESHNEQTT